MTEIHNYQINTGLTIFWKSEIEKWEFLIPNADPEQANVRVIAEILLVTKSTSLDNAGGIYVNCEPKETLFVAARKGSISNIDAETEELNCESVDIFSSKDHARYLLDRINKAALNKLTILEKQDLLDIMKTNELLKEGKEVPVSLITELEIIMKKFFV